MVKLCGIMGSRAVLQTSASHLDLDRAPYTLYGVKYIDLVSLAPFTGYIRADAGNCNAAAVYLNAAVAQFRSVPWRAHSVSNLYLQM